MYHMASEAFRFIGRCRSGGKLCHVWITVQESLSHGKHRDRALTMVTKTRSTWQLASTIMRSRIVASSLEYWVAGWLGRGEDCFKRRERQGIRTSVR
jgi:hypothetical protein